MRVSIITNKKRFEIFSDYFDVCINVRHKFFSKKVLDYEVIVYSTALSNREFIICRVPTQELADKICDIIGSQIDITKEWVEIDLKEII